MTDTLNLPEYPSPLDEAMKLAEDYARAWQHDVDGSYAIKNQAPKAKAKLREFLASAIRGSSPASQGESE